MTPQQAYEEDCRRCPLYHDGQPRRSWESLPELYKSTWVKDPTPRTFKHRQDKSQ